MATKVAVIGGGMAALTVTCSLAVHKDDSGGHLLQIAVYRQDWELGASCASGLNADRCGRIDEHGLHIRFGAYHVRSYARRNMPNNRPCSSVTDPASEDLPRLAFVCW